MARGIFPDPTARVQSYALVRARHRSVLHGLVLALILFGAFSSVLFSQTFPFQLNSPAAIRGLSLPSVGAPQSEDPVLAAEVLPGTLRREELEVGLNTLAGVATTATGDVAASAAGAEAPAPVRPYQFHVVAEGDTASAIAARFGIGLQYLLWANLDLRDGELLTVGQMLIVPSANGIIYDVRYGETLSDIAARYSVTVDAIIGWPGNGITSPDQVVEGQSVFVPDGVPPATIVPQPTAAPVEAPVAVQAPPPPAPAPAPVASIGLVWPVSGSISSYMDGNHPLGIDIDMFNSPYAAVGAATSGTVTFSGGDPCCSYGLYIVIVSPDGIETLYAHLSSLAVSAGQTVSQGQIIGNTGCTGRCTGNHLHFEVIDNGVRVNPLSYLP